MLENIPSELIWFFLGLVFLVAELLAPAFIVMFFGVGAWVVSLAIFAGLAPGLATQLSIFMLASLLGLGLFRKKVRRNGWGHVVSRQLGTRELDAIEGATALVVVDIAPNAIGKVELFGTVWNATADVAIKKGSTVEVVSHENLMLTVKLHS